MQLTDEQVEEVRAAAKFWRGYLGDLQANVILTADRKEKLATLVALAEGVLKDVKPKVLVHNNTNDDSDG